MHLLESDRSNWGLGANLKTARRRRRVAAERTAERSTRAGRTAVRRHAATPVRRRRSRTVGSTYAGVVLRTAPRQTNARITDGVSLHLVDGHLSSVAVNELNEAATLSRGNLDIGDITKALEERAQFILGDIATKATDEDCRVVRVCELVHWLHGVVEGRVGRWRLRLLVAVGVHAPLHVLSGRRHVHRSGSMRTLVAILLMRTVQTRLLDGLLFEDGSRNTMNVNKFKPTVSSGWQWRYAWGGCRSRRLASQRELVAGPTHP